jgi:mRNA interferase MazF
MGGQIKNRPAIILRELPPYRDLLVCGVSTQLQQFVPGFDELIISKDKDFVSSGLIADSVIRLGFLAVVQRKTVLGSIGKIATERHNRLLRILSAYLVKNLK